MPMDFDLSYTKRKQIDDLLKRYTAFDRDNRDEFIENLFLHLECFNANDLDYTTFKLRLSRRDMNSSNEDYVALFRGIADAISKDGEKDVVKFRSENFEKDCSLNDFTKNGRILLDWEYMHYKIKVLAKLAPPSMRYSNLYDLYMTIDDTTETLYDIDESGNDTDSEDDNDPRKSRDPLLTSSSMQTLCILQSLHDRIKRLETSIGLPNASQRRLFHY